MTQLIVEKLPPRSVPEHAPQPLFGDGLLSIQSLKVCLSGYKQFHIILFCFLYDLMYLLQFQSKILAFAMRNSLSNAAGHELLSLLNEAQGLSGVKIPLDYRKLTKHISDLLKLSHH